MISRKLPDDLTLEQDLRSMSQVQVAAKYKCSTACVSVHARRLGIGGLFYVKDHQIIDLVEKCVSFKEMQNILGIKGNPLRVRLNKLGYHGYGFRKFTYKYQYSHYHKRFSNKTKKQRFVEEKGICQWCRQSIGDGVSWQESNGVSYHHWIPIKFGGGSEDWNCMVLHRSCHYDPKIFKELHGFKNVFTEPLDSKLCNWCGKLVIKPTLGLCKDCFSVPDEAIIRDFEQGLTSQDMSKKHNLTPCSINRRLRLKGYSIAKRNIDRRVSPCLKGYTVDELIKQITTLYEKGFSYNKIAKILNVAPQTIWKYHVNVLSITE